jgi:FixJ family two-component response regulator
LSNSKHTVAVVDDDSRLLESVEDLLESAGYDVRTFSSATAFVEAGFSDIDCLITDIGMTGMDGLELWDIVKRARPHLPVFLITGRHEIGDHPQLTGLDNNRFFRKPFNGADLLAAVRDAIPKGGRVP